MTLKKYKRSSINVLKAEKKWSPLRGIYFRFWYYDTFTGRMSIYECTYNKIVITDDIGRESICIRYILGLSAGATIIVHSSIMSTCLNVRSVFNLMKGGF